MRNRREYIKIIPTDDGSSTLFSKSFHQHYHNPNGAVAESRHVFFETPSLIELLGQGKQLTIFETGFGTGLNLVLLLDYLSKSENRPVINYYSVEAYPIVAEVALQLNFGTDTGLNKHLPLLADVFKNLKPGMNSFEPSPSISLYLYHGFFDALFDEERLPHQADFIFHDPFSPEVNDELWTADVFRNLASISHHKTMLATYCAATSARASMAVAGWHVARAKGALGKREMTIASRNPEKLSSFKRVNEKRLVERYQKGDFEK